MTRRDAGQRNRNARNKQAGAGFNAPLLPGTTQNVAPDASPTGPGLAPQLPRKGINMATPPIHRQTDMDFISSIVRLIGSIYNPHTDRSA